MERSASRLMLRFLLLGFFFLWTSVSFGQFILKGKVTDAETGDPIAFASVFQKGKTSGITTDFEGNYFLARPLYVYISESVKEDQVVKAFIDFYFEAMDIIVPAVGYVPMLEDQKANALSAWQNFSS